MKQAILLLLFAAVGFFILFSPWTKQAVPFWVIMPLVTGSLAIASIYLDRGQLSRVCAFKAWHVLAGIASAALLYAVFWLGHFLAIHLLPFAQTQVESIYTIREGQNPWLLAALLICIIAPAEEIFWRGFLQRRLSDRYGWLIGFVVAAAAYALVHVWSFNLMLIAAAAVCGAFWGLLFLLTRSLWPCIISHALWDMTIFLLLPIR